ncbi:MAG: hypothetical protein ACRERE_36450 [Candidatus Entotheonellia bacterium]
MERLNHLLHEVGADEQHPLYTHGPTQSGMPATGLQGVVSDILRGTRELNVRQKQRGLRAEQKRAGDALQRPLRSRFWMRLMPGVGWPQGVRRGHRTPSH